MAIWPINIEKVAIQNSQTKISFTKIFGITNFDFKKQIQKTIIIKIGSKLESIKKEKKELIIVQPKITIKLRIKRL